MSRRTSGDPDADVSPRDRPWPPPESPWVIFQRWEDLLFAHWKIVPEILRSRISSPLALDLFDGDAWVALTPFRLTRQRVHGLPQIPGVSEFPELNLRTYVTFEEKPGVFFFSLDAGNPLAALFARQFFHLPYFSAEMSCESEGRTISFRSRRDERGIPAEFLAEYGPLPGAEEFRAKRGSLESWLTARYALYAVERKELYRAEVDHESWPLRRARAEIFRNTVPNACGIELSSHPDLLHFSRGVDVHVWPPEKVGE